jgi:hypothetical protein
MDVAQLDVVIQMTSYLPFDTIDEKGWLAQDANILSSTRWINVVEHALEAFGKSGLNSFKIIPHLL